MELHFRVEKSPRDLSAAKYAAAVGSACGNEYALTVGFGFFVGHLHGTVRVEAFRWEAGGGCRAVY